MSLTLEDVRGIVNDAIDPLRDDIKNLRGSVDRFRDLVNPTITRHAREIELLEQRIKDHNGYHEKIAEQERKETTHRLSKSSVNWQKVSIIILTVMNLLNLFYLWSTVTAGVTPL